MVESQTLPGRHTQNTPNVPPATTLLSMDVSPRVPLGSQCCVYIHVVCGSLETNHPFHCWCEIVSAGEFSKTRHMNIDTASSHHPPWQSPDKPDTFFAHRRVLYDGRTIALRLHTHTHTHVPAPTRRASPRLLRTVAGAHNQPTAQSAKSYFAVFVFIFHIIFTHLPNHHGR